MSTSTTTSRKSCGTADERADDVVLRQSLDDALLVGVAVARRLLEAVVEEVVTFLERLLVRRALLAPAAVDVQVGEDAQQPGAQVRARRERAPAAERARVRLLDEVLRLLARRDEPPRHAVDLIRELERLLLEADAVSRLRRELVGRRSPLRSRSSRRHPSSVPVTEAETARTGGLFRGQAATRSSWKPPLAMASSSSLAARPLLVPGERDLAHQGRVRRLEALVTGRARRRAGRRSARSGCR